MVDGLFTRVGRWVAASATSLLIAAGAMLPRKPIGQGGTFDTKSSSALEIHPTTYAELDTRQRGDLPVLERPVSIIGSLAILA